MTPAVFLSRPSDLSPRQRVTYRSWCSALADRGLAFEILPRAEYTSDPWATLHDRLRTVQGMVVFGFRHRGEPRSSPWMQVEAALAVAAGLPVLVLAERSVAEGVFDRSTWCDPVLGADLSEVPDHRALDELCRHLWRNRPVRLTEAASA